jgi:hypothetical protein
MHGSTNIKFRPWAYEVSGFRRGVVEFLQSTGMLTWHRWAAGCRRFGTPIGSHLQGSNRPYPHDGHLEVPSHKHSVAHCLFLRLMGWHNDLLLKLPPSKPGYSIMNLISSSLQLFLLFTPRKTYARRMSAFSLCNVFSFLSLCSYTFPNQASL